MTRRNSVILLVAGIVVALASGVNLVIYLMNASAPAFILVIEAVAIAGGVILAVAGARGLRSASR